MCPVPLAPRRPWKKWWGWFLVVLLAIWIADFGFSWIIQHSRVDRYLTARLETAFGRHVEVGKYSFSVLRGFRLKADSVTVAEDPRLGQEYFLRADELAVSFRWLSLLRGRFELGTLSLTRPSLNLVHTSDGRWNLAEWLPRPSVTGSASSGAAPRLQRIEIDSGRINFKRGPDKLPFAFVEVNGAVEQDGPGRWRLDLEAQPARAAVVVQQAGTVRLQGTVGGTSSRLRPADLELTWQDASLSDLLRLARNNDSGVRGLFSGSLRAHTGGPLWDFVARVEFRRLHRWDLPFRPDNPAANVSAKIRWAPDVHHVDITDGLIEFPRSIVQAAGSFDWSSGHTPRGDLVLTSSSVQMDDVLSWSRAFHSGIPDEVALNGSASLKLDIAAWPLELTGGSVSSQGIELAGGSLLAPVRVGALDAEFQPGQWTLAPAEVTLGSRAGTFRVEASAARQRFGWKSSVKVTGEADRVESLFEAAAALGWPLPRGWEFTGPARVDLRWQGEPYPLLAQPVGTLELAGASLRAPFLNRPLVFTKARMEFSPGDERVILTAAQAFGARWSGTLVRHDPTAPWQWDLSADHLSAADFDRWLNPQWREGLLRRALPFLGNSPAPTALPSGLRGRGKLTVDQLVLAPLELAHLHAQMALDGRRIELDGAQADFYGGAVRGSFGADLEPQPSYHLQAAFDRVNLTKLTISAANLRDRFAGVASGDLELDAHGLGRAALADSLDCRGAVQVRDAQITGMDLLESLNAASMRSGTSTFPLASAGFSCSAGKVEFAELRLEGTDTEIRATGSVDFGRNLDLHLRALPPVLAGKNASPVPAKGVFQLTGTLETPQLVRVVSLSGSE
jgi:hypothetical protein